MKNESSLTRGTCRETMTGRLRTAWAACLLPLMLLLALPAVVQGQFNFVTNNGAITITKYTGPGGEVTIPDTTNGLPVTSIGNYAFTSCANLTTITIPTGITNVGYAAFSYCTRLTNVTTGNSVTSIGDGAFYNCTQLSTFTIPSGITSIGRDVFVNCINLTAIMWTHSIPPTAVWMGFC
jgi:hypothetical protein